MAKMVGYACSLKLSWLNKAYQLSVQGLDETSCKEQLNEFLAFEIDSPTRLRKTREILMNVWWRETQENKQFLALAKSLMDKHPDYAPAIHLCMIYLSYPVVVDICRIMGKTFEFQDEIANASLKSKLFDAWGERGALDTTARRVTLTLKELGLLEAPSRFRYKLLPMDVANAEVVDFVLSVAMHLDGNSYYTLSELRTFPVLFPFRLQISKEQLMMDERFITSNLGGELSVALK
ncbi:MAG: hypothetical protein HUJ94_04200 [Bacteroidales bacterium]|nr:hypothetical protein [Bacteroidales bacterium]